MILEYKCSNCNLFFKLKSSAKDRGELKFSKEKVMEECNHCNIEQELNLNEIKAKPSLWVKYVYIIALIISILGFNIVYNSITPESLEMHFRRYSFVLGLPIIVPFLIAVNIVNSEKRAVKRFNQYYV